MDTEAITSVSGNYCQVNRLSVGSQVVDIDSSSDKKPGDDGNSGIRGAPGHFTSNQTESGVLLATEDGRVNLGTDEDNTGQVTVFLQDRSVRQGPTTEIEKGRDP